ncbi:MAG: right-handed parallel beta-helix repeat-containing protein, partial [Burkholderiales bacterium]|nr:right-handed parallel beta-helix repeat-containing protein [Opitutaceae bacterium]
MPPLRLLVVLFLPLSLAAQIEIHVSPTGRDTADGTLRSPVATLERAAALVRVARERRPEAAVTVSLAPGDYPVLDTLALTAADSGTAAA